MIKKDKVIKKVYTRTRITSKELKKLLNLNGEITNMGLYCGRSPNDIAEGKSADTDTWEISSKEEIEIK